MPFTPTQDPDDFFETPHSQAPKAEPKVPDPTPDDPRYYDTDDPWEHIHNTTRNHRFWILLSAGAITLALLVFLYVRFFSPYQDEIVQYGFIDKIERHGDFIKTYEGVLLPYRSLADTVTPYEGDIIFSAKDHHVAASLQRLRNANLPVRVEMRRYRSTLPWRGESTLVVTKADTADISKIFPPVPQHQLIPQP